MHAGAAVQAGRVRAGALHRAKGSSCALLLHQLTNDRLHRLGCLGREIGNCKQRKMSVTEISSSLFKSGSSSLKTERKSTLVATYGHDADVGLFPSGAGLFEKQGAKNK